MGPVRPPSSAWAERAPGPPSSQGGSGGRVQVGRAGRDRPVFTWLAGSPGRRGRGAGCAPVPPSRRRQSPPPRAREKQPPAPAAPVSRPRKAAQAARGPRASALEAETSTPGPSRGSRALDPAAPLGLGAASAAPVGDPQGRAGGSAAFVSVTLRVGTAETWAGPRTQAPREPGTQDLGQELSRRPDSGSLSWLGTRRGNLGSGAGGRAGGSRRPP